jgi:hypothetical protein
LHDTRFTAVDQTGQATLEASINTATHSAPPDLKGERVLPSARVGSSHTYIVIVHVTMPGSLVAYRLTLLAQTETICMYKRAFWVLLVAALLAAVMVAIRIWLVEPDEMGIHCSSDLQLTLTCRVRSWVIQGFSRHLFGPISVAAGVLGWIGASMYLSTLAMIVGMAGVVLYDFDFAAVGLLLGALFLVHATPVKCEPYQPQA